MLNGCQNEFTSAPVSNLWYQHTNSHNYYRVRQGDTLYSIAWMFGLDYRSIAVANHLSAPYSLKIGESLRMTNVPKGEYIDFDDFTSKASPSEINELIKGINVVAKKLKITNNLGNGYRVLTNIGKDGGQEVPHLHFHIFAGEKVGKMVV